MSEAILDLRFAIYDRRPRGRDSGRGHEGCELAGFLKMSGQAFFRKDRSAFGCLGQSAYEPDNPQRRLFPGQPTFFFGQESSLGSKTVLGFSRPIANRKSKIGNP